MIDLIGKKFILNGSEEWLIIENVQYEGNYYVYMVNKSNNIDSMYGVVHNDDQFTIDSIDPKLFVEKILPLFMDKFKLN